MIIIILLIISKLIVNTGGGVHVGDNSTMLMSVVQYPITNYQYQGGIADGMCNRGWRFIVTTYFNMTGGTINETKQRCWRISR